MSQLREIAARHHLFLLEDAAEAHGAKCDGRVVGSIGDASAFSFYANKIITTGEGGMVLTNDDALAGRARLLRGQGMDPNRRYWHPIVGYNYRMMNLPAAIGLAQLEKLEEQLLLRKRIAELYRERLREMPGLTWQVEQAWGRHAYWMFSVILEKDIWSGRDDVIEMLGRQGIETRPVFYPAHSLPPYSGSTGGETFPVAETLSGNGISLPTWSGLTEFEIDRVCRALRQCQRKG
jgi:perosamine synthetase